MRWNSPSLVVSSLALLLACAAWAETRPRYGGVVRLEVRAAVTGLDPGVDANGAAGQPFIRLLFQTLTRLDADGRPVANLATDWQQETDRRWRLQLRPGVTFSEGTPLTAALAAQSLRNVNPGWNVRDIGDSVIIETEEPMPNLPAVLALARNAMVLRDAGGNPSGTGPFTVSEWQPGRRLVLAARDDGWQERPYVDSVEILFGRSLREQAVDMDLGHADVIEVAPEQGRPAPPARRFAMTPPLELFALRFSHTNPAVHDARVRDAISQAIDRDSIANVLLQKQAEAAGGLLPNWLTGYAFLFPTGPRAERARQLRAEARASAAVTLVYNAADPLARLMGERIALNAADAGITMHSVPNTQNIAVPDVELVRVRLPSTDDATALQQLARTDVLALPVSAPIGTAPGDVYRATVSALKDTWAAPVVYVPLACALAPRVRNWSLGRDGEWQLDEVWMATPPGVRPVEAQP